MILLKHIESICRELTKQAYPVYINKKLQLQSRIRVDLQD
ncbi:hypothetical protein PNI0008_01983 [Streptococcus pneumoniae PNI0008]|nr:hypothetical protein PNI0008_01983 [Streptococcus pneumoniae PNI0008]ELU71292.1 hypothetical protein PCS81218_00203 [Streptococcus pneumoniae PCS81218]ELU86815.1 hypothetical protein PNI0199_00604 [Streptococcus pneumoniae PNI0199]ELU87460.1 hypothetical protein PNI0360_01458 [Streptococcus pneumoniae PNI0360]